MNFKPFNIGKYEFLEILGRGGMGEVYRVRLKGEQGFEKEFAIKRILRSHLADPEISFRFEAEARLTSILNHANIVHVFEFIKSGGDYFLVMEYIDGKNLATLREQLQGRGAPLPPEIALYIVNEICKGLDYAHHKQDPKTGELLNIIHRDISPQNVMLSYEGSVKLVDFGIAKAIYNEGDTQTGSVAGKLSYMSPEQAWGRPVDARSDIFSLCTVLFELLTSKRLFNEKSEAERLRAVQDCHLPNLDKDLKNLAPDLAGLIRKGLNPIADFRYQTIDELRTPLQAYLNSYYPKMDQRAFALWLNKHADLRSAPRKLQSVEMEPISISEKQWLEDGFSRLDAVSINRSKTHVEPLPVPPPYENSTVPIVVLSVSAALLLLFGIWVLYERKIVSDGAPVVEKSAMERVVEKPRVIAMEKIAPSPVIEVPTPVVRVPTPAASATLTEEVKSVEAALEKNPSVSVVAAATSPKPSPVAKVEASSKAKKTKPKAVKPSPLPKAALILPKSSSPTEITKEKDDAQKQFDRLVASVESAPSPSTPETARKLFERGMADFEQKKYKEAAQNFHKGRQLKPSFLPAWIYEVMSLEALGQNEKAREVAMAVLKLQPEAKKSPVIRKYSR